jgi:hypothetical protein
VEAALLIEQAVRGEDMEVRVEDEGLRLEA